MPALYIFWSRLGNRETTRRSRKSYESVAVLSSALPLLTLLQPTAVVPVHRILHRHRRLGSTVTFPVRTRRGDQNFRPRMSRRPASLYLLIFEQNQRKVYHEVLIAGDLSNEDVSRAGAQFPSFVVSRL